MVKKIRRFTVGEVIFSCVKWTILLSMLLIVLLPLVHIVAASFSSADGLIEGVWLWPKDFSIEGYVAAVHNKIVRRSYLNSFIYTIVGSLISITLTMLAAYPLSRPTMPGRKFVMLLFTFTMLFNGGLIPTFTVVNKLKLVNTIWAIILVDSVSVWVVIVVRTYLQTNIPEELYDAAFIDGCSDLSVFWKVVLPLSKTIIAVAVLMYAVGYWNGFFNAIVYLHSDELAPLQLAIRNLMLSTSAAIDPDKIANMDPREYQRLRDLQYLLKYSTIVMSTVPMLILYPFVQKHFVKGMMVGSIKG